VPGQPNRRDQAQREANQKRHRELKALRDRWVKDGVVQHGLSPEQSLQRIIDDATFRYLGECQMNDERRDAGEIVSDRRERTLAKEAAYFNTLAMQYNIADRQTKVQENRLDLMVALIQRVLREPDISLSPDVVRTIPRRMQAELHRIQDGGKARAPIRPVIPRPEDI
jgi:hypothetical protein